MADQRAGFRRNRLGRWVGPWRLYVLDASWCEWQRPFQRDGFRATYVARGPIVRNVTGQRWGTPRDGRVPRGIDRSAA